MLIILDGIDGCGKDTVLNTWKDYLTSEGNAVFDLKKYWLEKGCYPELSEIRAYDFIFSAEPTYIGAGKIIREELIKSNTTYPAETVAEAFSLDRMVLYKRIITPLLNEGKIIINNRGISTSLAYQYIQNPELTIEKLSSLSGNRLALEYRPDHLILLHLKPETAMERLAKRTEKQDDSIFEKLDFLKKLDARFNSQEYQKIFTDRDTQIHTLSTEENIDIMKTNAIELLQKLIQ
jgi:dTMP kinase